jgi:hypothetical protein
VAHTYNPKYSGGSDQEDPGSKAARENSSQDPISKNSSQKYGRVTQGESPEFKLQYSKKKKKTRADPYCLTKSLPLTSYTTCLSHSSYLLIYLSINPSF